MGSITLYLLEYAVLSALFLGLQEGKKQSAGLYMLLLIPLTQVGYALGQWYARA